MNCERCDVEMKRVGIRYLPPHYAYQQNIRIYQCPNCKTVFVSNVYNLRLRMSSG